MNNNFTTSEQSRNWLKLFTLNFVGVFNDNFLKNLIIFVSISWLLPEWLDRSQLVSLVSALFVLPYIFLSPYAGELARANSKYKVLNFFKWLEIPIMMVAALGFYFHSIYVVIFAVFLMGIQSCLYSPAKYGIIRDVGGEHKAAWGSGIFETVAFVSILVATIFASWIADNYSLALIASIFMLIAFAGIYLSKSIKVEELPNEVEKGDKNPITFLYKSFQFAKNYEMLNRAVLGCAMLWLIGSLIQMNVVVHTIETLGYSNTTSGIYMAIVAVGIAVGCTFTGIIAGSGIRKDLITAGLLGIASTSVVISLYHPTGVALGVALFIMTFFAGMFEVPCLSILQQAPIGRRLTDVMAYMNLLTFIFMLCGAFLFAMVMHFSNNNTNLLFIIIAVISILGITLINNTVFKGVKKGK